MRKEKREWVEKISRREEKRERDIPQNPQCAPPRHSNQLKEVRIFRL
jgi:hypothetical protein